VATIKIRVGVGLDANPASVFAPIPVAAKKAADKVEAEGQRQAKAQEKAAAQAAKAQEKAAATATKANEKAAAAAVKAQEKAAQAAVKAAAKIAAEANRAALAQERAAERGAKREAAAHERSIKHVAAMRDRYFREQQRQEEKAGRDAARAATREAAGRRGYSQMSSTAKSMLGAGARFAGSLARGAGVDLDMGSVLGRVVSMERKATDLANSALGTGVAGNEKRVNAGDLSKQARDIGATMGFDPERVLDGLQKFVGKTGDLKTGRDMLAGMAKLASATGSDLDDIVDAAGDVSNALGDVPNKGKVVESVMRAIAGQGKVGAVEMKDLATQMAKLGAAAGAFGGDKAAAIEKMGILAQLARATGGAASAGQATTAVGRFVTQLQTPARIKEFLAAGMKKEDIYDAKGGLRDPFEIIKRAIKATGADPLKMHQLFASSVGAKPVDALTKVYRDAGGGKAGMSAIDAEVERLAKSAMTEASISEAHAERMKTSAAKVEQFNAKLTEIGAGAAEKLLPALEKLGPYALKVADAFVSLVGAFSSSPLEAGLAAAAGGALALATGSGAAGAALAGVTIAGMKFIDFITGETSKGDTEHVNASMRAEELDTILRGVEKTGKFQSQEDYKTALKDQADLQNRVGVASKESFGDVAMKLATPSGDTLGIGKYIDAAVNAISGSGPGLSQLEQRDRDRSEGDKLAAQYTALTARLNSVP
jgi:TP901 family phage tail tape measure protein